MLIETITVQISQGKSAVSLPWWVCALDAAPRIAPVADLGHGEPALCRAYFRYC